jgi:hypothetical protein
MAIDDLYGGGDSTIRRQNFGERFSAFFDPFNKRDTAGITQEEAEQNEANNAGAIQRIQTEAYDPLNDLVNRDFSNTNGAFASPAAFDKWKEDYTAKVKDRTDSQYIAPGDLILLSKLNEGTEAGNKFLENAAEMNNRVGTTYKLYGKGKFLDILGSELGYDESGVFGITNPSIRTMRDKDGERFFYSADASATGANFEDMSPEEIEESNAALRETLVDRQGNPISPRKITDRGFNAAYKNYFNTRPGYAQGQAIIDILGSDNINTTENETDKILLDENTSRLDKLKAIKDELDAGRTGDFVGGEGTSDLLSDYSSRAVGQDVRFDKDRSPLEIQLDNFIGDIRVRSAPFGDEKPDKRQTYIQTPGNVFDMSPEEFNSLSIESQEKYTKAAERISKENLARLTETSNRAVNREVARQKTLGPTRGGGPGGGSGVTTDQRKANIAAVEKYYSGEKGVAHKELLNILKFNKPKLEEYLADPYQFALNNPKEDIVGRPVSVAEEELLRRGMENVDVPKVIAALNDPKTTGSELEQLLNEQLQNYQTQNNLIKERQANIGAVQNRNLNQASDLAKFAAIFQIVSGLNQDSDIRKAIFNKEVLTGFLNTGQLIPISAVTQRQTKPPPVETDLADSIISDVQDISEFLSPSGLIEFRRTNNLNLREARAGRNADAEARLTAAYPKVQQLIELAKTDSRLATNQKTIVALEGYKTANADVIDEKLKDAARQSLLPFLLEFIPFVNFENPLERNAFLKNLPDLKMSEDGKTFNVTKLDGKPSTFYLSEADIEQEGGKTFLAALQQIGEINNFLAASRGGQ